MDLKRSRRRKRGETYESGSLVESVRTARGPRPRVVATLGKLPGLDEEARVGWEHIGDILDGKARRADFFQAPPDPPEWARVNIKGLRVERPRRLGNVFLGLALWRRLRLDSFFNEAMEPGGEAIAGATRACILTLARFGAWDGLGPSTPARPNSSRFGLRRRTIRRRRASGGSRSK